MSVLTILLFSELEATLTESEFNDSARIVDEIESPLGRAQKRLGLRLPDWF